MTIKYLDTFTVQFTHDDGSETEVTAHSQDEALKMGAAFVGNWAFKKLFPNENTFIFGPGNGETTVFIRQDIDMDFFMGRDEDSDYEIHDCGRLSHRNESACIHCGAPKEGRNEPMEEIRRG